MTPPLFSLPEFGPPGPFNAAWVEGAGGVRLRTALFPAAEPRGSVILSTGRTEFIEKYFEVIGELLARGFTVLVHDWRGQGLSDRLIPDAPLKGHATGVEPFLDDLAAVVAAHESALPRPWIAMGHSMGGALTLIAVGEGRLAVEAVVLSAPMLGIATGAAPRWLARGLAWLLSRVGGVRASVQASVSPLDETFDLGANPLTHNRTRWERTQALLRAHPKLALGAPTWGWVDFAFVLAARLRRDATRFPVPLTVVAAGDERLVDTSATQAFCARSPRPRCEVVDGSRHELLMESDPVRERFLAAFDEATTSIA